MTEPLFSFAIVNWNTKAHLDECLESIYKVAGEVPVQILVADNDSSDGSPEMVEEKYPEVELVRTGGNLGFAGGHAHLFPLSKGQYHVLVNSDVRFYEGCMESWAARLEMDPKIGVMGCRIEGPDGHLQPSCRRFPTLWRQFLEAAGIGRLFKKSRFWNGYKMGDFDHSYSREVDQVMGSLFIIRREVVAKLGGLDTAYFMYYEEVDYCYRTKQAGYKVFFDAESSIYHEGGASSNQVKVLTMQRTMRSMRHYFFKNHGGWTWLPLIFILSLDLVTHVMHGLVTGQKPYQIFKAYGLGLWDVLCFKSANL